jgi:hypothetical protein
LSSSYKFLLADLSALDVVDIIEMDDGYCLRRPARYDLLSLLSSLKTIEVKDRWPLPTVETVGLS